MRPSILFLRVVCGFDYSLSALPSTLPVTQGGVAGVETVTAVLTSGQTQSVSFSISGLEEGRVGKVFSSRCSRSHLKEYATPCSATVSLTATGSAVAGSTVVTITASPLGLTTKPATFTLTVVGAFDYSLSALPSTLPVTQGGVAGVETVTAVLTSGQTQSVSFSISGLEEGRVGKVFSSRCSRSHLKEYATPCSATVSLTATGSAVAGSTVVTITASPLGLTTKPATFTLTVVGAFDYSLSALPSTLPVTQGGVAGVETVTAVLTSGQTQSVSFSISGLEEGRVGKVFSSRCSRSHLKEYATPCSATVSLTATGSAVAGSTVVTITASPLGLTTKPATFTLTVVGAFDYSLSALPSTLPVTQGGVAGVETVTAVLTSGQTQSVSFSISGLEEGRVGKVFSSRCSRSHLKEYATPCSATVSLTATGSAVAGSTVVTITASPLGLTTKPATFTLTVVGAFDYSLSALPSTLPVTQGGVAGVETVTAVLTSGQTQSVSFSISGLEEGRVGKVFSSRCSRSHLKEYATPCSATVSLTATGSAVAGSTVVTITASPLGLTTKPATFTLTVVGAFDYSLSALPSTLPVTQGGVAGVETVTAVLTSGQTQSVSFSISGLPSGVTASLFSPARSEPHTSGPPSRPPATFRLTAANSTVAGSTVLTFSSFFFNDTATTEIFTLSLHDALPISLSALPSTLPVTQGGVAGVETVTAVLTSGQTQSVSFSISGLPSGVTASLFSPAKIGRASCRARV